MRSERQTPDARSTDIPPDTLASSHAASLDVASAAPEHSFDVEIERFLREIDTIVRDAQRLVTGLSRRQLQWKATPTRWSIAQCLSHLVQAGTLLLGPLSNAIDDAARRGVNGHGPFEHTRLGNWFVQSMEPPPSYAVRAPEVYLPLDDEEPAVTLERFLHLQSMLRDLILRSDGLELDRILVASPAGDLLKLTVDEWFATTLAHERRHLWQARQVLAESGFPTQ